MISTVRNLKHLIIGAALLTGACNVAANPLENRVRIDSGLVEGALNPDTGVHLFLGLPFAAPPVGELRWKPPQPVSPWKDVRKADKFGPRTMQPPIFGDMVFRSDGMSEDCLYLNVWTPAKSSRDRLPVLVYFYGGGYVAGDGSEGRYDGANMATNGIVTVTVNYRLGLFGFMAHPDLTRESSHHASGNYGLLDQNAALIWVKKNIHSFGGDPARVTIAGESAGSISVSAQMASPLSRRLIAGAIGESGSMIGSLEALPLKEAEEKGVKLAASLGLGDHPTLAALRQVPAEQLLQTAGKAGFVWFNPTLDGYFLPEKPVDIYSHGKQAHVPLLAGVNSEESGYGGVLGRDNPTVENYRKALKRLYPDRADDVFNLYPASTESEVKDAAQDLASDRFISYGTWKWTELATKTGGRPTYYYFYTHPRPGSSRGAAHSAEIEYAMGNLSLNHAFKWSEDDYKVSLVMQAYFARFIKTGNPNGTGLPEWPKFASGRRMVIDTIPHHESTAKLQARYLLLDQLNTKK